MSAYMAWEILWALILGFTISAIVQAITTKSETSKWFASNSIKSISLASLSGAASSSCSYAAAAIARALVKQGADFTAAMAFQFASTNLVIELGILLALLLGWQFTLAQFVGGIIMITIMSLLFRILLPENLIAQARTQAQSDIMGKMEGHAAMDMSINSKDPLLKRIFSEKGKTAISHYFFMDWASLWTDIVFGLLIAGLLSTCVPDSFWAGLFFKDDYTMAQWIGPLVGPLIAVLSFVCSIGNVPMAAVLWQQGMSFGGVLSFLFADLLVLPLLDIYRKYYGLKMAAFLAVTFYIAMVLAAYACQWLFFVLGIFPVHVPNMTVTHGAVYFYTTILNLIGIAFVILLFIRFYKTGGMEMLAQMNGKTKNKNTINRKGAENCCH